MKDKQPEWEKDIRMCSVKSQTTASGLEIIYDPNALIKQIYFLLAKDRKALLEGLLMEEREHTSGCRTHKSIRTYCDCPVGSYNKAVQEQNKKIKKLIDEVL